MDRDFCHCYRSAAANGVTVPWSSGTGGSGTSRRTSITGIMPSWLVFAHITLGGIVAIVLLAIIHVAFVAVMVAVIFGFSCANVVLVHVVVLVLALI